MKIVLQRVQSAHVSIADEIVGKIGAGFCILAGIAPTDTEESIAKMAQKIALLRVFSDENGKMNRSLLDIGGAALIVSQFTLLADCSHGRRPSFTGAGNPTRAEELYHYFIAQMRALSIPVETGRFAAEMLVSIQNDGPATFILESDQ